MYLVYLHPELCLLMIVIVTGDSSSHVRFICEDDVMELNLKQAASDVSDIVVTFKGKQIAEANYVETMKWDPGLSETYIGRLILSNPGNLTITLQDLTTMDTGMFIAVVTAKGRLETISSNIIVAVAPVVQGIFDITMKEDGQNNMFTCGLFSDFGKPPVTFKWNVHNSNSHSIRLPNIPLIHCSAVGPAVETCGMNLTAVYQEENSLGATQEGAALTVLAVSTVIGVIVGIVPTVAIVVIVLIIRGHKRNSKKRYSRGEVHQELERLDQEGSNQEGSNQVHNLQNRPDGQMGQGHNFISVTKSHQ